MNSVSRPHECVMKEMDDFIKKHVTYNIQFALSLIEGRPHGAILSLKHGATGAARALDLRSGIGEAVRSESCQSARRRSIVAQGLRHDTDERVVIELADDQSLHVSQRVGNGARHEILVQL